MRHAYVITTIGFLAAACSGTTPSTTPPSSGPSPVLAQTTVTAAPVDSFAAVRARAVAGMLQRISGRENAPAESVFQNIKVLKGVPAGRFLEVMNDAFGHGLGVSCGFCHMPGQWASDQKPNKDVARDMLAMVTRVNTDLRAMRNLPDSNPMIGCITCHGGRQKPMLITP
jgi:hypothetical protein